MGINMNDQKQVTLENVARLIGSRPDDQHTQIRVRDDGMAYLSTVVGNNETAGIRFALPTYIAGRGYVGAAAAQDKRWVRRVYRDLKRNWPKPKGFIIDN